MGARVLPTRPVEVNAATSRMRAAARGLVSHGTTGLQRCRARKTGRG